MRMTIVAGAAIHGLTTQEFLLQFQLSADYPSLPLGNRRLPPLRGSYDPRSLFAGWDVDHSLPILERVTMQTRRKLLC